MNINSMVITLCPLYAAPASAQHLFPLVLSPPSTRTEAHKSKDFVFWVHARSQSSVWSITGT